MAYQLFSTAHKIKEIRKSIMRKIGSRKQLKSTRLFREAISQKINYYKS